MFIILSYDMNAKRVHKASKICCKYLHRVHKSVFEGELTEAKLRKLKQELEKVVNPKQDSVCIHRLGSSKFALKEEIGISRLEESVI